MTPLRQRFLDELTRRNYSPRTIEAYLAGVVRFVRHTRRAPDRASPDDLRAFQLHLVGRQVSWSLFNQTTCALRFFYARVLGRTAFVPIRFVSRSIRSSSSRFARRPSWSAGSMHLAWRASRA